MNSRDSQPQLPTWLFIVTDLVAVGIAIIIGATSTRPFSAGAMFSMVACVIIGAVVGLVPLIVHFERQKNEALDERQRALEALARTVQSSAEQISIATNGLHEISDLAQRNLRNAEHLPQKLQEKIAEFQSQLSTATDTEKEELERELLALRTSESERLDTVSQRIAKSSAEWAKLESATQQHLAAAQEALGKLSLGTASAIGKAQAAAEQALNQARTEAARSLGEASGQATRAVDSARNSALAEIDAKFTAAATSAIEHATREVAARFASASLSLEEKIARLESAARAAAVAPEVAASTPPSAPAAAPSSVSAEVPAAPEAIASAPASASESTPAPAAETASASSAAEPATEPVAAPPKRPRRVRREEPVAVAVADNAAPLETAAPVSPATPEPAPAPEAPTPEESDIAPAEPAPIPATAIPEVAPIAPGTAEPFASALVTESTSIAPPSSTATSAEADSALASSHETPIAAPALAPRKRAKKPAPEPDAEEPALALDLDGGGTPETHGVIERVLTSDGATRLLVTAYIGIGNRLFIRGHGPGLSWEKGVPLQFVSIGKWRWETNDAATPVQFKLLKNDEQECAALGEQTLDPGHQQEVTAAF